MTENNKIITVLHSGDMGDIVAGLGALRDYSKLHNDCKFRFILDSSGGAGNKYVAKMSPNGVRNKFGEGSAKFLKPLIERQPYIDSVEITDHPEDLEIDLDLNKFRKVFVDPKEFSKHRTNLLYAHQVALGVEVGYHGPWLEADPDTSKKPFLLFARSTRYQSAHLAYSALLRGNADQGIFVGTDLEWACLKDCFQGQPLPPRVIVNDALEMARLVSTSHTVVVNGTLLYWIAVGMEKKIFHELANDIPTTMFWDSNAPQNITYITGKEMFRVKPMSKGEGKSNG